jgi:hypothetical protein
MTFWVLWDSFTFPEAWFWSWVGETSCLEMQGPYFIWQLMFVIPCDYFVMQVSLQLSVPR